MTQDRRITDRHPDQPLDWSDAAGSANKAAADLTPEQMRAAFEQWAKKAEPSYHLAWNQSNRTAQRYCTDRTRYTYEGFEAGYAAALLASAAPAEEPKPFAYAVGLDLFKTLEVAQANVRNPDLKPVPLFTRAAPAAQPDAENVEADAYMYACDLMEQFQKERAARGVEIGTQGSLCDGIEQVRLKSASPSVAPQEKEGGQQ